MRRLGWSTLRWLGGRWAPAGARGRLAILIYHRVLAHPDPLRPGEPTVETFAWQMEVLARLCHVLPLSEAVARLREGTLPARAAAVTFDDGYADNLELAAPVLERLGLPATLFVATGFLDGGIMWNDMVLEAVARLPRGRVDLAPLGMAETHLEAEGQRRALAERIIAAIKYRPWEERLQLARALVTCWEVALPTDLMMRSAQLRQWRAKGMEVGAHTVHHPILAVLPAAEAEAEISASKAHLETLLGEPVTTFAYPNGRPGQDYTSEHAKMLPALGFDAAVTTQWSVNGRDCDPFQLARLNIWDRTPVRFALRLLDAYRRGDGQVPKQSARSPS